MVTNLLRSVSYSIAVLFMVLALLLSVLHSAQAASAGQVCATVGQVELSGDAKDILVCLATVSGGSCPSCIWVAARPIL